MHWFWDLDFDRLALIFRIAVLGLVGMDLILFNWKRLRGEPRLVWRTNPLYEGLKNATAIVAYVMIFVIIIVFDTVYMQTPALVIALDLSLMIGLVGLLVMPKWSAVTTEGVFVNGYFRKWSTFRTYKVRKRLRQIRFVRSMPLLSPVTLVTENPEAVGRIIGEYLTTDEGTRKETQD